MNVDFAFKSTDSLWRYQHGIWTEHDMLPGETIDQAMARQAPPKIAINLTLPSGEAVVKQCQAVAQEANRE